MFLEIANHKKLELRWWIHLFRKFMAFLFVTFLMSQIGSAASIQTYRRELEKSLSDFLNGRIESRLFLVFVKVKPLPDENKEKLPFANIDDGNGLLKSLAENSTQLEIPAELEYEIILNIDRSVPNGIVTSIKTAVEGRFEIDGQKRILTINRVQVYDPNAGIRPLTAQEKAKATRTRKSAY